MEHKLKYIPKTTALRIKELFKSLSKDYIKLVYEKEKEICSFGVFTDSGMSSFIFGYNTKEGMDQIIQQGKKDKAEDPTSTLPVGYSKWWLPEWTNGVDENAFSKDPREMELFKLFDDLLEAINSSDDSCDKEDFPNYKDDLFDLLCQSLKELKAENTFSIISNNFYLLVQEQDNGVYDTRKKSLLKILSQKQLDEYLEFEEL